MKNMTKKEREAKRAKFKKAEEKLTTSDFAKLKDGDNYILLADLDYAEVFTAFMKNTEGKDSAFAMHKTKAASQEAFPECFDNKDVNVKHQWMCKVFIGTKTGNKKVKTKSGKIITKPVIEIDPEVRVIGFGFNTWKQILVIQNDVENEDIDLDEILLKITKTGSGLNTDYTVNKSTAIWKAPDEESINDDIDLDNFTKPGDPKDLYDILGLEYEEVSEDEEAVEEEAVEEEIEDDEAVEEEIEDDEAVEEEIEEEIEDDEVVEEDIDDEVVEEDIDDEVVEEESDDDGEIVDDGEIIDDDDLLDDEDLIDGEIEEIEAPVKKKAAATVVKKKTAPAATPAKKKTAPAATVVKKKTATTVVKKKTAPASNVRKVVKKK